MIPATRSLPSQTALYSASQPTGWQVLSSEMAAPTLCYPMGVGATPPGRCPRPPILSILISADDACRHTALIDV